MRKHSTRKCGWFNAALMFILLMPALCQAQGSGMTGPVQAPPEASGPDYVDPRPLDQVIASSDQGDLTMEMIMQYCYYNHMTELSGLNLGMVNQLPDDMLAQIATHIVSRKAASDALYAKGTPEEIKQAEEGYDLFRNRILVGQIIKDEVTDKITSPTAETIQAYYDKHKFEYVLPFSFTMRHLILLTYEPYVVKAGDTLESIARNVCGDPALASNIRSDEAQRPLRKTETENQPPLYEGEKLLVPMPAKRAQAVHDRLQDILKEMDEGKSFEQLANDYSEGMMQGKLIGPLPSGTKEMLPDLMEIAHKTPAGQVSDIFQTKHGYQVIQIVEKQEERQRTLDEVRVEIVRTIKNEEQNDLFKELVDKLYANPNLEVFYDEIAKGDMLAPETVIAKLGDKEFFWADAEKLWDAGGRPQKQKLIDEKVIRAMQPLQMALAEVWAKPILDDADNVISKQLAIIKPEKTGQGYMELRARSVASEQVDDASIEAFYEAHKDELYKIAPSVNFNTMVMVIPPDQAMNMTAEQMVAESEKMKVEMTEKLKAAQSAEDFMALADEVNKTIIDLGVNPPGTDGDFMDVDKLEKSLADAVKDLEPGQWSEPFNYADRSVMSILLKGKEPETYKPLDQVREEVKMRVEKAAADKELGVLEAKFAQDAHLQIKL